MCRSAELAGEPGPQAENSCVDASMSTRVIAPGAPRISASLGRSESRCPVFTFHLH